MSKVLPPGAAKKLAVFHDDAFDVGHLCGIEAMVPRGLWPNQPKFRFTSLSSDVDVRRLLTFV